MINSKAKWIWINFVPQPNEYAFFEDSFVYNGGGALFSVCAETDYVLYVNGERVAFGQYAGYPFEKYCDEIDISSYCSEGENKIFLTVRYEGANTATHIDDGAGVIFSLELSGDTVLYSSAQTRGGYDNRYIQHQNTIITAQLGLTSGMRCGETEYVESCVEMNKTLNIKKRPVKKTEPLPFARGVLIDSGKRLYDLGREMAGYIYFRAYAKEKSDIIVSYGEHIADGCVRRKIGKRDFGLEFRELVGECEFFQPFIRVAGRYLEVTAPDGIEISEIGIVPYLYPLTERQTSLAGLDRKIYETSVRTLRLCINMHYEDCPWREQGLYVLDSRNQMLCGYYAFGETEMQRESLILMSKGVRDDGMLELTYPAINTPAIPMFSLMYPVSVCEYIEHTGDREILDHVMPTILGIMKNFSLRLDGNRLLEEFEQPYWNFYEWTEESDYGLKEKNREGKAYHLLLNCAYVYSLERFKHLCEIYGTPFDADIESIRRAIEKEFYHKDSGLFSLQSANSDNCRYTQLGNAWALLIGLGDERTLQAVKYGAEITPATLSMLTFVYDALIERDPEHKSFILDDIRKKYGYMLECGATSFWETLEGESAFRTAGSLCHGWSAVPVYYYSILK